MIIFKEKEKEKDYNWNWHKQEQELDYILRRGSQNISYNTRH